MRSPLRAVLSSLVAASLMLVASGCRHNVRGPCDTPPPFHVVAEASPVLNPDAQGRPLPTVILVLQLKSRAGFDRRDYSDIYRGPKDALGEDLLRMDELMIDPGQTLQKWVTRDPGTRFIAAVGVFRQPSGNSWHLMTPLQPVLERYCKPQASERRGPPQKYDDQLHLKLEEYRIEAETPVTPKRG